MSENINRKNEFDVESNHEAILAHPVFDLMRWLSNNPTGEELARELALNYFRVYSATQVRLSVSDEEGSLHFVGVFCGARRCYWRLPRPHSMASSRR